MKKKKNAGKTTNLFQQQDGKTTNSNKTGDFFLSLGLGQTQSKNKERTDNQLESKNKGIKEYS